MSTRRATPLLAALLAACGGGGEARVAPSGPPVGMSGPETAGDERPTAVEGSIELTLRRVDGTFLEVGEQRGQPVLLYVFATFDGVSQMVLNPLRNVIERHPGLRVIGIAAQPSARLLVDAYEHALHPPFPVTYDPEETVRRGESDLGALDAVPTLVLLDERGVEIARHTGFLDERQLEAFLAPAL
ncbi:MAG TPA: TlpA disulfide reductase family protein [Sandaracinaceae bacterium LLY-WYZ-13_1]|nr:TlpA disulfide reductase family protein [Sandaracinaceae bacterium LLY-WYZ-13_1]